MSVAFEWKDLPQLKKDYGFQRCYCDDVDPNRNLYVIERALCKLGWVGGFHRYDSNAAPIFSIRQIEEAFRRLRSVNGIIEFLRFEEEHTRSHYGPELHYKFKVHDVDAFVNFVDKKLFPSGRVAQNDEKHQKKTCEESEEEGKSKKRQRASDSADNGISEPCKKKSKTKGANGSKHEGADGSALRSDSSGTHGNANLSERTEDIRIIPGCEEVKGFAGEVISVPRAFTFLEMCEYLKPQDLNSQQLVEYWKTLRPVGSRPLTQKEVDCVDHITAEADHLRQPH